jgi:hypothetical protein
MKDLLQRSTSFKRQHLEGKDNQGESGGLAPMGLSEPGLAK